MNTHPDTPIYDQAFEAALAKAVDIDDMEQLTLLEDMNSATTILPAPFYCDIPSCYHDLPF